MQSTLRAFRLTGLCLVLLMAGAALPAAAQPEPPRSDTGRRLPAPPVKVQTLKEEPRVRTANGAATWFAGMSGGVQGGGDLWRTETVTGAVVPWLATLPFSASRFTATLDNNFAVGLFAGRHLTDHWSLRLDLSSSRMDVAAEALQGQVVNVVRYDRLTTSTFGLGAEVQLVDLPSYPYLSGGLVLRVLTAARESELDQKQLGARLGVGYLKAMESGYSLRVEARLSRSRFEAGSFLPGTTANSRPLQDFRPADHINILELILAVQANL
jgi:hypothetical protein